LSENLNGRQSDRHEINYDLVKAAVVKCEAHPEHVAYLARVEAGNKVLDDADAHEAAVESMMTLGGRSY
jgi:hypothetical protein